MPTIAYILPVLFSDGSVRYLVEVNGGGTMSAGYYLTREEAGRDAKLFGADRVVFERTAVGLRERAA